MEFMSNYSPTKKVILLGATGLTGSILLQRLLDDERIEKVITFNRSALQRTHPKLTSIQTDLYQLEQQADAFYADVVFCCIGTTKAKTPDQNEYRKIDYGIPLAAAKLCKQNGIPRLIVISALGANPESPVFYNRLKGEMEKAVLAQKLPLTYILQPSLIAGNRQEIRTGEWVGKQVARLINPFLIGGLRKYRSIHPEDIARAMLYLGFHDLPEQRISSDYISELAKREKEH